ncbi:leucine-rich repeat domain-containing protein [Enterococcus thailandicus]|uniref:leucine-rich repeat domain-containing protein n=1 Tax=Enterococcus thailandicus TaxID=417368 RepID=UPI0022EBCB23|nr:leucine-rich repeat domain-containing protein [Enterococcus thailandicus]MDA3973193.1 leucine-rich repeat domain-containing protein [Enterococcus thailandicus]MDA3975373.1 leucine-rich repeat domain-containing protein [Enterococcus thailandicus]MDA3980653.1 leucine-rich repeat domain-containing protein [Enterococcus thailandicus]
MKENKKLKIALALTSLISISLTSFITYQYFNSDEKVEVVSDNKKEEESSELKKVETTETVEKEEFKCPISDLETFKNADGIEVFSYYVNQDCNEIVVDSYVASDYIADLEIPDKIKDIEVTAIRDRAFANITFKSIKLPDFIKYIGKEAFRESDAKELILPKNLEVIDDRAFQYANNLEGTLEIPENVKYIGQNAFQSNYLTNIIFPESLEVIEDGAFLYSKLYSIEFKGQGKNLKKIGVDAFSAIDIQNSLEVYDFENLYLYFSE